LGIATTSPLSKLSKTHVIYSFGRSWTGDRLLHTKIKLPVKQNSIGKYKPDWQFMEDYIKSLPYSANL
jgi:hypothetical protein